MMISFGSIIVCLEISFFFTICLILLARKKNVVFIKQNNVIFMGIIIVLVRLLIPVNFPFTITIPVTYILPEIMNFFLRDFGNYDLYTYFLIIWWSVAGIKLFLLIRRHYNIHNIIIQFSKLQKDNEYSRFCEKMDNRIEVLIVPIRGSPIILGLIHPKILIPEYVLNIPKKYIYDIIIHEFQHYKNHDLWIVYLMRILICVYWWNNFIYVLQEKLLLLMELDSDRIVLEEGDEQKKIDYAECLIKVSRIGMLESKDIFQAEGISFFKKKRALKIRIERIIEFERRSEHESVILKKIYSIIIIICIFMDLSLVPEAYSISGAEPEETFEITSKNAYFLEKSGGYELYIDGEFVIIMEEIDNDLKKIPIY